MRDLNFPVFFPDATRGVVRTVDSIDIENTKTPGVLVNTYHLYKEVGEEIIKKHGGAKGFMNWKGAMISDSGGFQVMSIVKKSGKGSITDEGVHFPDFKGKELLLTPEESIRFQFVLKTDLMVVLDDFTPPKATRKISQDTVHRTIMWAKRSKEEFERQIDRLQLSEKERPLLIGVAQGGDYLDLRKECIERLVEIGFDGIGYGGWPINDSGEINEDVTAVIAENTPKDYLLYGLGVGKPHDIVICDKYGYKIFDCVLPTRDARHGRLYVYNADSINEIDVHKDNFYSFYNPLKIIHKDSTIPVSTACDCLLCSNYTRAYLYHLWKIHEIAALRLATTHNLRFYSLLMENLQK